MCVVYVRTYIHTYVHTYVCTHWCRANAKQGIRTYVFQRRLHNDWGWIEKIHCGADVDHPKTEKILEYVFTLSLKSVSQ